MKYKNLASTVLKLLCGLFVIINIATTGTSCTKQKPIDLEPFKKLARDAKCADMKNQLFLIDDKLVFWNRRGSCPDNSFAQVLFGKTPGEELCSRKDSITGPQQSCPNTQYQNMFETIINNLDKNDLGLGTGHQVTPISF